MIGRGLGCSVCGVAELAEVPVCPGRPQGGSAQTRVWRSLGSPARCQRVGGLGWACSVHGILPMTLAAISVRSAGSQAMTVSA
jgi:hypothetical protein